MRRDGAWWGVSVQGWGLVGCKCAGMGPGGV